MGEAPLASRGQRPAREKARAAATRPRAGITHLSHVVGHEGSP
jgi:hypothetical protein